MSILKKKSADDKKHEKLPSRQISFSDYGLVIYLTVNLQENKSMEPCHGDKAP